MGGRAASGVVSLVAWAAGAAGGGAVAAGAAQTEPAPAVDRVLTYFGTASDPRSGAFLYRETHFLVYRNGNPAERVVLYSCRNGTAFARKIVASAGALLPDFVLDDATNGMRAGIHTRGVTHRLFYRGNATAAEKTLLVTDAPGMVADAGFDAFVRSNWQPLMAEQALGLDFLLPSRSSVMHFKVRHLRSDRVDDGDVEVFRLSLAGVLGLIVPSIDVYYRVDDHQLMRYVGLSDVEDAAQNNYKADILFHSADRKIVGESVLNMARQAPLAPCR